MLTLHRADSAQIASVLTAGQSLDNLLTKEWLLTNGRGGYASSTVIGCNTRRYHGLLIGSHSPPANRIMALANCLETVILKGDPSSPAGNQLALSTFEFDNKFAPEGYTLLREFRRELGAHFDYEAGQCRLTKSVYLLREAETVVLEYDFKGVGEPVEFAVRPFVGLRDFHSLRKSYAHLSCRREPNAVVVRHEAPGAGALSMSCPDAAFEKDPQWWFNFVYRAEEARGQDSAEDLWTPGFFKTDIKCPTKLLFWATLGTGRRGEHPESVEIDAVREELDRHRRYTTAIAERADEKLGILYLAGDQFITKRQTPSGPATTILAGYPWFADWGRDAFIALGGLALTTGRFDDARSILTVFAGAADDGMIPNYFDDRDGAAQFNSVDA